MNRRRRKGIFNGATRFRWHSRGLKKLTSAPEPAYPDFDEPLIFERYASGKSFGAVFAQKKSYGKIHQIHSTRRAISSAEWNYSTSKRESLAEIFVLRKFSIYLLSYKNLNVLTYHKSLSYAFQKLGVYGRLAQWMVFLLQYDFKMKYMPRRKTVRGDFRSSAVDDDGLVLSNEGDLVSVLCLLDLGRTWKRSCGTLFRNFMVTKSKATISFIVWKYLTVRISFWRGMESFFVSKVERCDLYLFLRYFLRSWRQFTPTWGIGV